MRRQSIVTRASIENMYRRAQKYVGETALYFVLPEKTEELIAQGADVPYARQVPRLHLAEHDMAPPAPTSTDHGKLYSELVARYDDQLFYTLEHLTRVSPQAYNTPKFNGLLQYLIKYDQNLPEYSVKKFAILPSTRHRNTAKTLLQPLEASEKHFSILEYYLATTSLWYDLLACDQWEMVAHHMEAVYDEVIDRDRDSHTIHIVPVYFRQWLLAAAYTASRKLDVSLPVGWNRPILVDGIVDALERESSWLVEVGRLALEASGEGRVLVIEWQWDQSYF